MRLLYRGDCMYVEYRRRAGIAAGCASISAGVERLETVVRNGATVIGGNLVRKKISYSDQLERLSFPASQTKRPDDYEKEKRRKACVAVAHFSNDAEECKTFLSMLGLI